MPMPPSTYVMRKNKTKTSINAKDSKQSFSQHMQQQKRDLCRHLLARTKITPNQIDSWITFLDTVKNKSLERDENTRMGKFIKVIEKTKDFAEQISKEKQFLSELRKPARDVIAQPNFKHAFGAEDFVSIAMVTIIFLKVVKRWLKK